jgi:hypothetical protein
VIRGAENVGIGQNLGILLKNEQISFIKQEISSKGKP